MDKNYRELTTVRCCYTFSSITDTDRLNFVLCHFTSIDFYEDEMVITPQYSLAGGRFKGETPRECIDQAIKDRMCQKCR